MMIMVLTKDLLKRNLKCAGKMAVAVLAVLIITMECIISHKLILIKMKIIYSLLIKLFI